MNNTDDAKKLAEMLDKLCAAGTGHINVTREGDGFDITEQTQSSMDCCKNMACSIPTLHKGIDDDS